MPIRPDLRHFYGKEWKTVTRPRILLRAGNRCEACGVVNHEPVLRAAGWWTPFAEDHAAWRFWYEKSDAELPPQLFWTAPNGIGDYHGFPRLICRVVVIVLTVAHKNHVAGDDRDENLTALCQWCHLNYDREHHRETRADRKDAGRPLLQMVSHAPQT